MGSEVVEDGGLIIRSATEQCDRLREVQPSTQVIGEFLEWAQSKGWQLAEWDGHRMYPVGVSVTDMLADFVGLDLERLEDERRRILDQLRKRNEE